MRKIVEEKRKDGSKRVYVAEYTQPSLTDQSYAAECEINNIVRQYVTTGQLPHRDSGNMIYAEQPIPKDMLELNQFMIEAKQSFAALPPKVRLAFDNDVAKFADAVTKGVVAEQLQEFYPQKSAPEVPPQEQPPKADSKSRSKQKSPPVNNPTEESEGE